MMVARKGPFVLGIVLFVSFLGALVLILSPVFGGKNGLNYADDLFNRLSKGSSRFIPKLLDRNEQNIGRSFRATLVLPEEADQVLQLCKGAGVKTEVEGKTLVMSGDLGKLLRSVLEDANQVFEGEGSKVAGRYGWDEGKVLQGWWTILSGMEKYFKKNLQVKEADIVSEVAKKAIEPAYNFRNIEPQKVADRWGVMSLLLVFYVIYTVWWGYAILYLFEGLGLSMKKARVKKEVG